MKRALVAFGWILIVLLAVAIATRASVYFRGDESTFFENNRDYYASHTIRLMTHIAGGVVALVIGPLQFWGWLRRRYLRVHRALGATYLIATIGFGAGGALLLAPNSYGGLVTHVGFGMLAALWIATGALGYQAIRAGQVNRHREWMTRSYALTFAAVTLRLWIPILMALGLEFTTAYQTVAWLSWVPNLMVAELIIVAKRPKTVPVSLSST